MQDPHRHAIELAARRWRAALQCSACNVQSLQCVGCRPVLLAWRVVLHECVCCCSPRSSASNFDAVAASLIKLQLQAFAQQVEPRSRLGAYGCIRCRVVTDAFQVVVHVSSSHGFWPRGERQRDGAIVNYGDIKLDTPPPRRLFHQQIARRSLQNVLRAARARTRLS